MKVTALMENTSGHEGCIGEFGLSFLVEANGRCVLFDAGQSDATLRNAEVLGIDMATVDTAVLSHGHFDHANGFPAFLSVNDHAPIYARVGYDGGQYAEHPGDPDEYIGVADSLKDNGRVKVVSDARVDLGDGFTIVSYADSEPAFPIEHFGLFRDEPEGRVPDKFKHEQCLLVEEGDVRLLITGCTHRGIRNVMHWSAEDAPTHVVGGFHFMKVPLENADYLNAAADDLLSWPAMYYTCHCTGLDQFRYLKERMDDRLEYIAAGQSIEL
ncbi:MAG: MBL fold metallo-hydrolase [Eggerthellaceae bacterium]|nr:MBL fold metallo-hydrolase [Eggerthellaceae bacterium]MBQ9044302.1 MBL fold metallo-hydrolase [Eggerthellaceae bacterium]